MKVINTASLLLCSLMLVHFLRFHPLLEFDEGKRSCRRRLAGHNRRRRKTQPEDTTSTVLHCVDGNKTVGGNVDIVNLLAVLARGQGIRVSYVLIKCCVLGIGLSNQLIVMLL